MALPRIGIWLIGAHGGVATTATVGLSALAKGVTQPTALVSELPPFAELELTPWDRFVVGGHEIRATSCVEEALLLHRQSRVVESDVLDACQAELEQIDKRIRPGTLINAGATITNLASDENRSRQETPLQAVERLREDLRSFAADERLERVVVVNVASTEPPFDGSTLPTDWPALEKLLDQPDAWTLPASSLYAIAAFEEGCSFINFTPSPGSTPDAVSQLAQQRGCCHMGYDGKTGETLMKSVLAPMFAKRNLDVMSWVGHNIFGNMDGRVLDDPVNKAAKITSKDQLLGKILGYQPQTLVSIEYIESMGDWKTAWDHIHFRGFLGTPMALQFIWQGCDSLLAAPLVLDLVRFTERSARAGETGLLTHLASFFKTPLGVEENDFFDQYRWLHAWAEGLRAAQ